MLVEEITLLTLLMWDVLNLSIIVTEMKAIVLLIMLTKASFPLSQALTHYSPASHNGFIEMKL